MNKREEIQRQGTQAIVDNRFVGILEMSPRVGKTKTTIDALKVVEKEINVLILAPFSEIIKGWKKEFITWGQNPNISVEYSIANSLKKNKKTYHLIIADEIHQYNLKVLQRLKIEQLKGTRILGLTGTLDGATEFTLNQMFNLNVIYSYDIEQAIKDKIVSDYRIHCIGCELDNTDKYIVAGTEEKPFKQTELEAYNYWNTRYNLTKKQQKWSQLTFLMLKRKDIIYNSKTKIQKTNEIVEKLKRCLIFTSRQLIAEEVSEKAFHSNSDKKALTDFQSGHINKLGVVSMVSMGVTILDLKDVVFQQLKSDENTAIQQAMRAMNMEDDRVANIYIVYLKNTQDEVWLQSALKGFNKNKIQYL